jgi:cell division GTPase FtsZ
MSAAEQGRVELNGLILGHKNAFLIASMGGGVGSEKNFGL